MPETILLLDDSPTIRSVVKVYLMSRKFEFLEAEDGERALQVLRLVPVSLVIADINMPNMDGITFLGKVRADPRPKVKSVPVVLLTSDTSEDARERGMKAGANAFVKKPISPASLNEIINQFLPTKKEGAS